MGLILVFPDWDAISDPLVGYLSDRTVTPLEEDELVADCVIPIR